MRRPESSPNLHISAPESPPAGSGSAINSALADLAHCHGLSSAFESASSLGSTLDDYEQVDVGDLDWSILKAQRQRLKAKLQQQFTPGKILLRDKITFMAGTVSAMISAYWLGFSPATFYRIYTVAAFVLLFTRWALYKSKRQHYYLFDFCYMANLLLLFHIWICPHSAFLHKVTFAYAAGPLAWSVVAFRNSLVFHSVDKITSLFLHWYPACVVWTERWHPDVHSRETTAKTPEALKKWHEASFLEIALLPMIPYLIWAVLYYIKIFMVSSEKIQKRGYETLFRYCTENRKSAVSKFVARYPTKYQPLAYMGLHLTLTAATFAVAKIWWNYYHAHTFFLVFVLSMSSWNGASFYFDVFAHRYLAQLGIPARTPKRMQESNGQSSPTRLQDSNGKEQ
ncbi:hypothetical protein WJX74_010260 [Apatococcus lobatus]|uniref:Glycerophosphocholine acyltransferase 1 n=1 Tax=Apatococcus lobatus TaxID=904363 RepID=A0AAW1S6L5_9CHLO